MWYKTLPLKRMGYVVLSASLLLVRLRIVHSWFFCMGQSVILGQIKSAHQSSPSLMRTWPEDLSDHICGKDSVSLFLTQIVVNHQDSVSTVDPTLTCPDADTGLLC